MQPFPHPSDATHTIWSRLANWLQRYSSLKVWTTTDDDGPLVYYKLTLWAFGSGELKMPKSPFQRNFFQNGTHFNKLLYHWTANYLILLVKRNTLILYSYFHWMFIFLLLVSVRFYRCIEKRHSKSFLPHFSTFVEILLKSCRKITAGISVCKLA